MVSAERRRGLLLPLALGALTAGSLAGAADPPPDSEFLEYLGSWEESDEDWLTVAGWPGVAADNADAEKDKEERKDDEQES